LQYAIDQVGWRDAHMVIGIICLVTMVPLAFLLRRRPPEDHSAAAARALPGAPSVNMPPAVLQGLLILAGIACCIAMSMPQVHMVAYCGDLGYGAQRGAEILSVMLGLGIASRLISGLLADKIGPLPTILIGSGLQGLALLLYLPYDGLISLYVVSAIFGLAQGGIVPTYALIVRQFFPSREAATRVSLVFTSTIVGMALGGWISGEIYDLTGSYRAAFLNGTAWNLLNFGICVMLLLRFRRARAAIG
jgi:predicted MFS family arabinose efflux permease